MINSCLQSTCHSGSAANHTCYISLGVSNKFVAAIDGVEVSTTIDSSLEAHLSGVAPLLALDIEGILNSVSRSPHCNPVAILSLRTI